MNIVIENKFKTELLNQHIRLMRSLCLTGAFLFILWAVILNFIYPENSEIWPFRIAIALLFVLIAVHPKIFKDELRALEWMCSIVGFTAAAYVFFVAWKMQLNPAWVTGCLLIMVGVLNFITYLGPMMFFVVSSVIMSTLPFFLFAENSILTDLAVVLNLLTGVIIGCYSSLQRNQFLKQILQTESMQNKILNNMSEGIVLHAKDGTIQAINPSTPKILGLTEDQILGKTNKDQQWATFKEDDTVCLPEEHPSAVAQKTGKPVLNYPIHLWRADGTWAWLDVSAVPLFTSKSSEPDETLVTIRDVTSLRKALQTIESQKESLAAASRLSALGEMSAGIAHEINNPLAIIMGTAESIDRKITHNNLSPEELKVGINKIFQTTRRISKIVNSMRALSRQLDSDDFVSTPVSNIIENVLEIVSEGLSQKDIKLTLNLQPNIQFQCLPGQISQAVLNLLSNSRDAIEAVEKKWIHIEAFINKKNKVEISVSDSGPGIPPEIRSKIMQPFFTTKEVGKGTGLGLSLIRTIVQKHQGDFYIDEHAPHTRFVMTFPISIVAKNSEAA